MAAIYQEDILYPNSNDAKCYSINPHFFKSKLICRVNYCNTLPDIPFDLKFITCSISPTRFIKYNTTSLELSYKHEILTEHDLGIMVDLVNKDIYTGNPDAQLDPIDEKLLEEDILTSQETKKRSKHHAKSVSWLRRTEYISTESVRFQPQNVDKIEAKVGYSTKKKFHENMLLYMDHNSQIKAIEKTFQDNKKPIEKHYSKPNVVPVEILPVFVDFKLWKYPYAQVIFDSDPAIIGHSVPAQIEEMSHAMIRGVMDERGEQFVAYFLPLEETLEKHRRDFFAGIDCGDGEEYEYKMVRQYNWNIKNKASKGYEENYFFVIREDGVYYNELETRVRLHRRREKIMQPNNTRLIVRHRSLNADEFKMQKYREKQLELLREEEEDEEEEEEEEQKDARQKAEKNNGRGLEGENEEEMLSRSLSQRSNKKFRSKSTARSKLHSLSKSRL